jgi:sterol desaturase/sphingolipid hydroxylase (fatty acid hydroxylase superfamily)
MRQGPLGYFADMVASPLLAGGLSMFALTHFTNFALLRWLATVMLGVALWTFIEYATHRVIYHRVAAFKKYHEAHHADPQAYIGAPHWSVRASSSSSRISQWPPLPRPLQRACR